VKKICASDLSVIPNFCVTTAAEACVEFRLLSYCLAAFGKQFDGNVSDHIATMHYGIIVLSSVAVLRVRQLR